MEYARDRYLWLFVAAAVIAGVICITIANRSYDQVHAWGRIPTWLSNPVLLAIILLVSLVLAAHATAVAHRRGNATWRLAVPALFVFVALALVLVAYLVYRAHNFLAAFYVSLVLLVALLVHVYGVAMSAPMATVLEMVPALVLVVTVVYVLWYMADESSDCIATYTPVYIETSTGAATMDPAPAATC